MDKSTLIDYMLCRTSPEQEQEILDWLDSSPENRAEMDALDETFDAMVLHSPVPEKIKKRSLRPLLLFAVSAAACLAIVFGGGYLFSSWRIDRFSEQTIALYSPEGQTVNVTLQDGTKVWLTGGSTLEYPVVFSKDKRRVSVTGEAMFDVTRRDDRLPFVVSTFAGDVRVLGTKFDVVADNGSGIFSTALLRGKVSVSSGNESYTLTPGQVLEIRGFGEARVYAMDSEDDYRWIEGVLVLNTSSFRKLAGQLERAYDVRVVMDGDSEPVVRNRGKIHTSDGLEHALGIILSGTGHSYEIDYDTRQVHIK